MAAAVPAADRREAEVEEAGKMQVFAHEPLTIPA